MCEITRKKNVREKKDISQRKKTWLVRGDKHVLPWIQILKNLMLGFDLTEIFLENNFFIENLKCNRIIYVV